jgi:hypothetical protein
MVSKFVTLAQDGVNGQLQATGSFIRAESSQH